MSEELWGAPRIHDELLKFGFGIAETTFSKYMIRHRGPPSQTWSTFLRNHADVGDRYASFTDEFHRLELEFPSKSSELSITHL